MRHVYYYYYCYWILGRMEGIIVFQEIALRVNVFTRIAQ